MNNLNFHNGAQKGRAGLQAPLEAAGGAAFSELAAPAGKLEERALAACEQLRRLPVVQEAFQLLACRLPDKLRYHNAAHTGSVFEQVVLLGLKAGLGEEAISLLAIAAAWHDTGFVIRSRANEGIGARLAAEAMRRHGYGAASIREVQQAILGTHLRSTKAAGALEQVPTTELSKYLLDADLSNFGQADSLQKTLLVFNELQQRDVRTVDELLQIPEGMRFLQFTYRLIKHHQWQTQAGRELYEGEKRNNLLRLEAVLFPPIM